MSRVNTEYDGRIGIAILAKAPIPGLTKTRLIPHLGAEGAAALQRWLLQRTVATALMADVGPVSLWCAPDTHHPDFAVCRAYGPVTLQQQPEGDLGARMLAAINQSPTPAGTLVIGTDCPMLSQGLLRQAAACLRENAATVIPAEDGGYVLIGLRQGNQRVFSDIDWSTDRVMAQTRQRLDELAWRWNEFSPLWDVDRREDFERLLAHFPDASPFSTQPGLAA